ncbi:unnamed protein product, partial [Rotaria magnacalcarata]
MPLGNVVTSDGMSICIYAIVDMLILSLRYIRNSHPQMDKLFKIEALGPLSVPNSTKQEYYNYQHLVWELTLHLNKQMGVNKEIDKQNLPPLNIDTSDIGIDSDMGSFTAKSWDSVTDYFLHDNLDMGAEAQNIPSTSGREMMTPSCFAVNDLYCLESIKNYEQNIKASPINSNIFKETFVNIPNIKDELTELPIKDQAEALLPKDLIENNSFIDKSFNQKLKVALDKFDKTIPKSVKITPNYSFIPSRVKTDHSGRVIQNINSSNDSEPPVVWYIGDSTSANAYPESSQKIVPTYDPNNQADLHLLKQLDLLASALECIELVWEKQPSNVKVEIWNLQTVFNMSRTRKFIGAAAKEFDGIKNMPPYEFENSKWS